MGVKKGGNASTFADTANVDPLMREGGEKFGNTHLNNAPEGQRERSPHSGIIAIFAILTPPGVRVTIPSSNDPGVVSNPKYTIE